MRYVLALLSLCCASSIAGTYTDVLPNGDFSATNQLTGWTCSGANWNSDDANGVVTSGSMSLSAVSICIPDPLNPGLCITVIPGTAACTSACMSVRPGADYDFGGQSRIVSGGASLNFSCQSFAAADCSGSGTSLTPGPIMSAANAWNSTPASASGTLSNTALAANCVASIFTLPVMGASGTAEFDNLLFGTDVIFANGFE